MSTGATDDNGRAKKERGEPSSRTRQRKVFVDDALWQDAQLAAVLKKTNRSELARAGLRQQVNAILGTGSERLTLATLGGKRSK